MKQTAVEWLVEESMKLVAQAMTGILNEDTLEDDVNRIVTQAKSMEREQISDAHYDGYYQEGMADTRAYYDKKYKTKTI